MNWHKDMESTNRFKEQYCENKIKVAGVKICINYPGKLLADLYKDYQDSFDVPDIRVVVSEKEIEDQRADRNGTDNGLFNDSVLVWYNDIPQLTNIVLRKIANYMPYFNTVLMHGAVVAKNNSAYMFMAPSGTGKTTRVKLWLKEYEDSIVINGDKPFIIIKDTCAMACGSPWCGKEGWNTNKVVPLRAIFLLERANEFEESRIEEISIARAFPTLLQQTYRPKDINTMRMTLTLLKSLQGKVKFYHFYSKPTLESIRLAHEISKP